MPEPRSFYVPVAGGFEATELTRGPWDPASQHAGPPCALLGSALDAAGALAPGRLTRVVFEILAPVPIATLAVEAEIVRPGRSVELIEGTLSHEGRPLIRGRAWRLAERELDLGEGERPEPDRIPGRDRGSERDFFPTGEALGYHRGMEQRFVHGGFLEPGPGLTWMRMRVPLVEGEEPTPLQRLLVAADSGNGVSAPLDYRAYTFINTDVSVTLRRHPRGEWVALDAVTYAEPDGIGMSDTRLHDEDGMIGRATQTLVVAAR